ncbi:MAG: peptidoglycan recognition protein family protein [Phycisphaerales bacterium]|nr:peptidoglycan recognition protein family protein [Phycisphaerales bacterium]
MTNQSTRRWFLGGTLLLLGGCAGSRSTTLSRIPGPIWEPPATLPPESRDRDVTLHPTTGVLQRAAWAKGDPIPGRMDRMRSIERITVHHDGMSPFTDTALSASAARLESIRRAHLRRRPQPFGDIGYHFAIDPAGRIWAARPTSWQGAHVRSHNQRNLGIVVLGNYDQQRLNVRQESAIVSFLSGSMRQHGVRSNALATHQEFAATACPGKSLQRFMNTARRGPLA